MKKIISLILVLMLCSVCFCREICSTYLGNIDTDNMARYHVGVLAISSCQDIVKDKDKYDFERVDNNNLGAYLLSEECMNDVFTKFSVKNGDLYRSIYQLTDNIIVFRCISEFCE